MACLATYFIEMLLNFTKSYLYVSDIRDIKLIVFKNIIVVEFLSYDGILPSRNGRFPPFGSTDVSVSDRTGMHKLKLIKILSWNIIFILGFPIEIVE